MRKYFISLAIVGALSALFLAFERQPNPVERGKYLVTGIGCGDCHTPWEMGPNGPEPDAARLLSGHPENAPYPTWSPADMQRNAAVLMSPTFTAFAGPWGISFAANLTPDTTTGLGEWTEETFVRAIRSGKHQGQPSPMAARFCRRCPGRLSEICRMAI